MYFILTILHEIYTLVKQTDRRTDEWMDGRDRTLRNLREVGCLKLFLHLKFVKR